MAGQLAPPAQLTEFYGLWTFATRLASTLGPLSYGAITWATGGHQRVAIAATAVLFLLGLLLLWPVDMAPGRARAPYGVVRGADRAVSRPSARRVWRCPTSAGPRR